VRLEPSIENRAMPIAVLVSRLHSYSRKLYVISDVRIATSRLPSRYAKYVSTMAIAASVRQTVDEGTAILPCSACGVRPSALFRWSSM
jgi:hypothetical protein